MINNIWEKEVFTAKDISTVSSISLAGAYNLLNSQDFPSFKIGRRLLVRKSKFVEWIEQQEQKEVEIFSQADLLMHNVREGKKH